VVLGIVAIVLAIVNIVFAAIGHGNFFAMIASGIWTGIMVRCCASKDSEVTGFYWCRDKDRKKVHEKNTIKDIIENFHKKMTTKEVLL